MYTLIDDIDLKYTSIILSCLKRKIPLYFALLHDSTEQLELDSMPSVSTAEKHILCAS